MLMLCEPLFVQMTSAAVAVNVTGSENVIASEALSATPVALFAGTVVLTAGAISGGVPKVCPALHAPKLAAESACQAKSLYCVPVPLKRSELLARPELLSVTPISTLVMPEAGPSVAVKVPP